MMEMTPEQALEMVIRLGKKQSSLRSHGRYAPSGLAYSAFIKECECNDFAEIASVIEQLQAENDELKSRMPATAFSDHQLFGPRPQGR